MEGEREGGGEGGREGGRSISDMGDTWKGFNTFLTICHPSLPPSLHSSLFYHPTTHTLMLEGALIQLLPSFPPSPPPSLPRACLHVHVLGGSSVQLL